MLHPLHYFVIPIIVGCFLLVGFGEMGGEHAICARAAQQHIDMKNLCK